jgi:hypothetical protein
MLDPKHAADEQVSDFRGRYRRVPRIVCRDDPALVDALGNLHRQVGHMRNCLERSWRLLRRSFPVEQAAHHGQDPVGPRHRDSWRPVLSLRLTCQAGWVKAVTERRPGNASLARLIAPTPLARDIEEGRIGDCHNGHHATLDRVAHHQVSGVRHAAWHVE